MTRVMTFLAALLLIGGADALQAQSSCSSKEKSECAKKCEEKKAKEASASEIEFATITREQLVDLLADGSAIVYDARGEESFEKGHIDGSILYAGATLPEDKASAIVFYCGGPRCAAAPKAARKAIEQGYTNVMVFTGGWIEWSEDAASDQAGL